MGFDPVKSILKFVIHLFREIIQIPQTPECKQYSPWEVLRYNMLFWNLSFIHGLNFTHYDVGPMQKFTLDPTVIATWGTGEWIFALVMLGILGLVLYSVITNYVGMSMMTRYIVRADRKSVV